MSMLLIVRRAFNFKKSLASKPLESIDSCIKTSIWATPWKCIGTTGVLQLSSISPHSMPHGSFHMSRRGFCFDGHHHEEEGGAEIFSEIEEEEEEEEEMVEESENKTSMYKVALGCFQRDLIPSLERWVADGNVVTRREAEVTLVILRNAKLYARSLLILQWIWEKKPYEFDEFYYATYVNCLFKSVGMTQAESFFNCIPSSLRGITVYRALLRNYALARNVPKAEKLFHGMKNLGFKLNVRDCNNMLHVYLSEKKKIPDFLKFMESKNIKPDIETYRIAISARCLSHDSLGMERLVKDMKAVGLEPDAPLLFYMAKWYINFGMLTMAKSLVVELEKHIVDPKRKGPERACRVMRFIIWLYALLNDKKNVKLYWKVMKSHGNLSLQDYDVGILSWGSLGKIKKAEKIFQDLLGSDYKVIAKHYNSLLKVYADCGLKSKAELLLKQILSNGLILDTSIISSLVKLYVNLDDLENAESMLYKSSHGRKIRPAYLSMLLILKKFSERGETDNAERIFESMREIGYTRKSTMYEFLMKAYITANTPFQGISERMLIDNFEPNYRIHTLLMQLDAIEKGCN